MRKVKDIDYRILYELMRNSKTSDRQLAKRIGVSQPTITRRRASLEKELIDGYTAVPKWDKFGYELFAIILFKSKFSLASKEKYETVRKKGMDWLMSQPSIIMGGGCRGDGINAFMISVHKNYTDLDNFMYKYRLELGDTVDDMKTIIINLAGRELLKPLHLKYLAETK